MQIADLTSDLTIEECDEVLEGMGGVGNRDSPVFSTRWQPYAIERFPRGGRSQEQEANHAEPAEELPFHDFDADEEEEDGSEYEHSFHDFDADEESDVDVTVIIIRKTTYRK